MRVHTLLFLILSPSFAFAGQGLEPIPMFYNVEKGPPHEIKNMPKIRSQDSALSCYSFTASTLIDYTNCVDKKITNCAAVNDKDRVSTSDLTRFGRRLDDKIDATKRENFPGIFSEGGGNTHNTIVNAQRAGGVVSEACAPYDQVVSKVRSPLMAAEINKKMWADFKTKQSEVRYKIKTAAEAAAELKNDYCLPVSNEEALKAFNAETYDRFLDQMMIPERCKDPKNFVKVPTNWKVASWPEPTTALKTKNYAGFVEYIKNSLDKKLPMSVGFCAEEPLKSSNMKDCTGTHSVVITGFKTLCDGNGVCKEAIQVQNSWGQEWNDYNNNGWMYADKLLDRTFYETHALTRMEPR